MRPWVGALVLLASGSVSACPGPTNVEPPSRCCAPEAIDAGDAGDGEDAGSTCVSCQSHPIVESFRDILHQWPVLRPGVGSRYFSSFDRTGDNQDGFAGTYSSLYTADDGSHVIFDAMGPGVLRTLWFTSDEEGGNSLDLGELRFYFDDERQPRIRISWRDLFSGGTAPFLGALVADNAESSGGYVSWAPLPYSQRLVVTTQNKPFFYIAQYETHPVGTSFGSYVPEHDYQALAADWAELGGVDTDARGEALTFAEVGAPYAHAGAGVVEGIQFAPDASLDDAALHAARIRLYWDGATRPAVDVPLDMFFGSGLGRTSLRAVPFVMEEDRWLNRFRMPFRDGFRLEVDGADGQLRVAVASIAAPTGARFEAHYSEQPPTSGGEDFTWLDISGAGTLVGTVLAIHPETPKTKRWWEGDLRSYVDGARTPALHGTGHEDDHLGGWSNTWLSQPYVLPMHGEPKVEILDRDGQINANVSLYRLWPGLDFLGSMLHGVEHGNLNSVRARYEGVTFYYAHEGVELHEADRLDTAVQASRDAHQYQVDGVEERTSIVSAFEGRASREELEGALTAHTGPATFVFNTPPQHAGCVLRRSFDQTLGRQGALLSLDGRPFGRWYTAEQNPQLRWAERDLFLPASVLAADAEVVFEVAPDTASPWSVETYRLLCVHIASDP